MLGQLVLRQPPASMIVKMKSAFTSAAASVSPRRPSFASSSPVFDSYRDGLIRRETSYKSERDEGLSSLHKSPGRRYNGSMILQ